MNVFNKEMTPSSRQHFRCTLLPPSESLLKDSRLEAFAQEIGTYHISGIMAMAKKREIFKVDEDALKDMMASESISCGKSGTDVGENVHSCQQKRKKCTGS